MKNNLTRVRVCLDFSFLKKKRPERERSFVRGPIHPRKRSNEASLSVLEHLHCKASVELFCHSVLQLSGQHIL